MHLAYQQRLLRIASEVSTYSKLRQMDDIEHKYAHFELTEVGRQRLLHLAQFQSTGKEQKPRVIVVTVVVQDGNRTIIEREVRCG